MSKEQDTGKKVVVTQKPKEKKHNLKKFFRFFKDTKSEAKKVVWPNRKQIKNNLVVVLVVMAIASVIIWPLDFLLINLFNFMFF